MCSTHWWSHCPVCNRGRCVYWRSHWSLWRNSFVLIFELLELEQALAELPLSLLLLDGTLTNGIHAFPIDEVAGARSACEFTVNALPVLFEIGLDVLQAIQCRHFVWLFRRWRLRLRIRLRWCMVWRHLLAILHLLKAAGLALRDTMTVLRVVLRPTSMVGVFSIRTTLVPMVIIISSILTDSKSIVSERNKRLHIWTQYIMPMIIYKVKQEASSTTILIWLSWLTCHQLFDRQFWILDFTSHGLMQHCLMSYCCCPSYHSFQI